MTRLPFRQARVVHPLLPYRLCWRVCMLLVLVLTRPHGVWAQQPDSTEAASDSVSTSAVVEAPVPFFEPLPGRAVHRHLPARHPALDAPGLLAEVPGSFVYDFGTPGWPDGWSPQALSPQQVGLHLRPWPFDDLVTGRPRYDLLPLSFLRPLHTGPGWSGSPQAVYADTRPYVFGTPYTELRYRTGGGLQSIMALHVQRRRLSLLDAPGILQVLGGYGGHANPGAYRSSRLKAMRQLYGRVRYQQHNWGVEVANMYNRRRLGTHGGVAVPPGRPIDVIYDNRGLAQVIGPEARRQTIRNDLAVTTRARLLPEPAAPTALTALWTAQTFRYGLPAGDTLTSAVDRYGLRLEQALQMGPHRLDLKVAGWTDHLDHSNVLDSTNMPKRLHASLRDSLRFAGFESVLQGSVHLSDDLPSYTGSLRLARSLGPVSLFVEGRRSGQPVPLTARHGWGASLTPLADLPTGRLLQMRTGVSWQWRTLETVLFGFAHRHREPLDYLVDADGQAAARTLPSFRRAGAGAVLAWRRQAERGFYLTLQPSFADLIAPMQGDLQRLRASLPRLFGRGTLGARYALFEGDLDLDVYLEGRAWSAFASRTLHPPTGLLVLPALDSRTVGPSGTLDVHVEAGIRTATLFVSYENMLSGTPLMAGNLLVPVYPLPAQRFRFGVFWPIFG